MEKVFEIYIKTTPERLWEAITDPEIRAKYNFGAAVHSDWTSARDSRWPHRNAGFVLGEGEMLEVDPPRRLVHTMVAFWSEEAKAEGTTRVTWDIEPVGDSCRLTVTHDQMREGANDQIYGGWPMILSGLKTWLEIGRAAHDSGIADVRLGLTRSRRGSRGIARSVAPSCAGVPSRTPTRVAIGS